MSDAEMSIATESFDLSLDHLEKMTINAMKRSFASHAERVKLIHHELLPGYALLFAELSAKALKESYS